MLQANLMQTVFDHQLVLLRDIRSHLLPQMTPPLQRAFEQNEIHLERLTQQKSPASATEIATLKILWDTLTQEINALAEPSSPTRSLPIPHLHHLYAEAQDEGG